MNTETREALSALNGAAHPVGGARGDYDDLLNLVGTKRFVLIGEASHGTHEFYRERARISRRLIDELGFNAVAIEGDWPDAYRVNRYVMGLSSDPDADAALRDFRRFPAWMWRNLDVMHFVSWLHARNASHRHPATKARFLGLDLYSLRASMEAVIGYLDRVDPVEARRARQRYSCFDHIGGGEGQAYGYALAHLGAIPCEDEAVAQLIALRHRAEAYLRRDGWVAEDELFFAEQNAVVVRDAEEYYQQMYRGEASSWNLRDRHMAATLDALADHLDRQYRHAKIVVWEHNSHVGDARATQMTERGELNVGQLARERYHDDCLLVGFTTFDGHVSAASEWGASVQRMRVRPARPDSHESLLHEVEPSSFWLATDGPGAVALRRPRLERAIGVIYRPETELQSHYFAARLADQFDALIHLDRTHALEPLERTPLWDRGEPPETFPTGL